MSSTKLTSSEPFVTRDVVCEFLSVSSRTVDRMLARGIVVGYRPLGPTGPVRFRLSDVEKAMTRAMDTGKRIRNPQVGASKPMNGERVTATVPATVPAE